MLISCYYAMTLRALATRFAGQTQCPRPRREPSRRLGTLATRELVGARILGACSAVCAPGVALVGWYEGACGSCASHLNAPKHFGERVYYLRKRWDFRADPGDWVRSCRTACGLWGSTGTKRGARQDANR